jgi:hypothetical protein
LLVLQESRHGVEQRKEQDVVSLIGQQERRLGHGHEEIQEHGTGGALHILQIRRDIIYDRQQCRMERLQASI